MVSVVIPCHNDNKTIGKAVESVLNQSYKDVEIIIIDNGRDVRPDLEPYIKENDNIKIFRASDALGVARARNMGVQKSNGEYVAFLDADDYWAEDKLQKQLKVMTDFELNGEKPLLCFSGRQFVSEKGKVLNHYIGCKKIVRYEDIIRTNQINCSSVILRREDAISNEFPDGELHEDYAAWLKLLSGGGYAAGINQPLLYYRIKHGSRSGNKLKSAVMNYRVYRYLGISRSESMKHMFTYTIEGFRKYLG